jgi:hypothetical protein
LIDLTPYPFSGSDFEEDKEEEDNGSDVENARC